MNKPSIVIVGAGYAGLTTAILLQKKLKKTDADIILVNKHPYHYQTTWLHENAAGSLAEERTKVSLESIIDPNRVTCLIDTVLEFHTDSQTIKLEQNKSLSYDYLVIALGFETETYHIPGIEDYAYTIVSIDKASLLKKQMEAKLAHFAKQKTEQPFTIVVGGGGFTGVEYLGELMDQLPIWCEKYQLRKTDVQVLAVEREHSVMPGFNLELGEYAMQVLEQKGIKFILGAAVKRVNADHIIVEKNRMTEKLPASIFIWTAGVRANQLVKQAGLVDDNQGSVMVTKDLRAPNHENVFVIGDCAAIYTEHSQKPIAPTAQMAMQQAKICANNIAEMVHHRFEHVIPFHYKQHGIIASLGKKDAIGVLFNNKKIFGKEAVLVKRLIENRVLYQIGGLSLWWRKRK